MAINILKSIVEEKNINFIINDNGNSIKIPYNILMEEVELKKDGKDGELDTYIENYNKCIELKNNITNYVWGILSEESIDKLHKDIIAIKEYKNIDIILEYIDINIALLEKRAADLSIHLGLEQKDIEDLRLEAIEKQISSQEEVKLTDEYLEDIIKELDDKEPIKPRDNEDKNINKDCKPLLVVSYNPCYEYNEFIGKYEIDEEAKFNSNEVSKVYFTRQPLNGIVNNNHLSNLWIKICEFSNDLTNEEIATIKGEVIINLKPRVVTHKDIDYNDKWLTASQIKKTFGLSSGTRHETIDEMYKSLGSGYQYVGYDNMGLYNSRVYDKAEKVYTEECGKTLKYE